MSKGSSDETRWAMATSALGEVFLGKARPRDAIREIKKIDRSKFKAAIFDEFWWDLAQAYRCQAVRLERGGSDEGRIRDLRQKARSLLEEIRQNDQVREDKLFSNDEVPTRPEPVCLQWEDSGSASEGKRTRAARRPTPMDGRASVGVE